MGARGREPSVAYHPWPGRTMPVVLVAFLVHGRVVVRMPVSPVPVTMDRLHHIGLVRAFLVAGFGNPQIRRHQVQQGSTD